MPTETAVVWNPSSRVVSEAEALLMQLREKPGVTVFRPDSREASVDLIVDAADRFELIVAAGGDGTVGSVVAGIMESSAAPRLGVIPLGTGNDFARSAGIPLDWQAAIDVLDAGAPRTVDVLECRRSGDARWIANMVTGGNSGRYLQSMSAELKQRWGPFCYLRGVIDAAWDLQPFDVTLQSDESSPETLVALNVFFANGRSSGGGLTVSPDARLDDGLVDAVIIRDGDPGEIAHMTAEYLLRDYREHDLVQFRRGRRFTIECEPPVPMTADGDLIGETPIEVLVHPQAIRLQTVRGESG